MKGEEYKAVDALVAMGVIVVVGVLVVVAMGILVRWFNRCFRLGLQSRPDDPANILSLLTQ